MSRASTSTHPHSIQAQLPVQAQHRFEAMSTESFDRIAFAMSLLKVLRPKMDVAVYPATRHVDVQHSHGRLHSWAMVGIPRHATRENIARALIELSGRADQPFLLDLLCRHEPVV